MPPITDSPVSPRQRPLRDSDPAIAAVLRDETTRQNTGLELIASENFVSRAVLEAVGSVLTNKYAEGYPGRRYYGGCEHVDVAESLAIQRALALFGADHANVQPHSGAQANMAAYFALVRAGDTVLGMDLAHGGHLTHGHPLNFSGQLYTIVPYGVRRDDQRIDYDELERRTPIRLQTMQANEIERFRYDMRQEREKLVEIESRYAGYQQQFNQLVNLLTQDLVVVCPKEYGKQLLDSALRQHGVAHFLFHPAHIQKPNVAEAIAKNINGRVMVLGAS